MKNVLARHPYIQMLELGFFHQIFTLIFSLPYIDRVLEERGGRTKKVVHVYKFVFLTVAKQREQVVKYKSLLTHKCQKKQLIPWGCSTSLLGPILGFRTSILA